MFTTESFKAEVARKGGESKILGLYFNNSYVKIFRESEPLDYSKHIVDEAEGIMEFIEKDPMGYPMAISHKLEYLERISSIPENDLDLSLDDYDPRSLRG